MSLKFNSFCLKRNLLRLFSDKNSMKDCAYEVIELSPAEEAISPMAIFESYQLNKVTGPGVNSSIKQEIQKLYGGKSKHAASIIFKLRNVSYVRGYIYHNSFKYQSTSSKESFFYEGEMMNMGRAMVTSTPWGGRFFGHWMTEDLPLQFIAHDLAYTALWFRGPKGAQQQAHDHRTEYMQLLGMSSMNVEAAAIDELVIAEDFAQNALKRERYQRVRAALQALSSINSPRMVMLLRGATGTKGRELVNEIQIANRLSSMGFEVLCPEETSAADISRRINGCEIVIGVEGSQLIHGLYNMRERGAIITLNPPYRMANIFKDYTDAIGSQYATFIGDKVEEGFYVHQDDLLKFIDRVQNEIAMGGPRP